MIKKWLRISDFDFETDIRAVLSRVIGEYEELLEKVVSSGCSGFSCL